MGSFNRFLLYLVPHLLFTKYYLMHYKYEYELLCLMSQCTHIIISHIEIMTMICFTDIKSDVLPNVNGFQLYLYFVEWNLSFDIIIILIQDSHRSLKTWKVLEFENLDSSPGKSWNFCRGPWKSWNLDI